MFGRTLAKKFGKILHPKKVAKASMGAAPKVAGAGLFIGAGIAADKIATGMSEPDYPKVASSGSDDVMIDKSYSLLKIEDIQNGAKENIMTPANIMSVVMVIFILLGMSYPCWRLSKRIIACIKRKKSSSSRNRPATAGSSTNPERERHTVSTPDLEIKDRDHEQQHISLSIPDQKVKFGLSTDIITEEKRIEELEREIQKIRGFRKSVTEREKHID